MQIFIGGLWPGVKRGDVARLVRRASSGPWYRLFSSKAEMANCEMLELTDRRTGHTEYCAVVKVDPNRASWDIIHALNGKARGGHLLSAHRWFDRARVGERRHGGETPLRERRSGAERRRKLTQRMPGRSLTRAVSGFERSHGA